jgi:hypothetical protein
MITIFAPTSDVQHQIQLGWRWPLYDAHTDFLII